MASGLLAGNPGTDEVSVGTGGELESALTRFLGAPNQYAPLNLDVEGKNPHITHNLPMAFWGKSHVMEALVEYRIVNKDEWYTKKLMPWLKSDQLNFSWMVFKYDKNFFEVQPYGGNPSYIQSGVEAHSDRIVQRGMAFTIAHGFWKTEMGKQQYAKNLEVLEDSAVFTVYHLIIMAILKAKNQYRNWELRFKTPVSTIAQALKRTKIRWGIINKGMHEFRRYHAELMENMEDKGVHPNILALPPKTKIIMSHMHESEYDYMYAGPGATKVRREGQAAYDTIRGCEVYETTVFNEIMFGQLHNPLRRIREYGSFFWITNFQQATKLKEYRNQERFSAKILDADKDGQETQVFGRPLFRLSQRFDTDGNLSRTHADLVQDNINHDLRRRLNDRSENHYIDMFIGYDPSRDSKNPYYVMQYLGEMWEEDVRKDQLRDFATTACNKLECLTDKELCAINDASKFMDELNRVDFTNPDHVAYWQAVALSGLLPGGENAPKNGGSTVFQGHSEGCAMPPYVFPALGIKLNGAYAAIAKTHMTTAPATPNKYVVALGASTDNIPAVAQVGGVAVPPSKYLETLFGIAPDGTRVATATNLVTNTDTIEIVTSQLPPLGFGHPAGLRTLANMLARNETRGYKTSILEEAVVHAKTMEKFHSVWKTIFPDHELGRSNACPYYFRSGTAKKDELTAFGLNLYDHARYPVFAVAGTIVGNSLDVGTIAGVTGASGAPEANVVLTGGPGTLGGIITAGLALLGRPAPRLLQDRLNTFAKITDGVTVRESLADKRLLNRLTTGYRSKQYEKDGKAYELSAFLADIATQGAFPADDAKVSRVLTGALEILLDGSNGKVDWASELTKLADRPIKVKNMEPFTSVPKPNQSAVVRALNTRLVIAPESFREVAELAQYSDDAQITTTFADIPVRPMNIFNPNQPIGIHKADGNVADDAATKKAAIMEFRFAAAPQNTNTSDSLSTSPHFSAHLGNIPREEPKRNLGSEFEQSSAPVFKRRAIGGAVMGQNLGFSTSDVMQGIPVSYSTYEAQNGDAYDPSKDPSGRGVIPANIALSDAFHLFTFDSQRKTVGGAQYTAKHYRSTLVARFNDWAQDTNPCHRIFAQSWITSKITRQNFENFWDQDVIPLVSFELWRIRQRYFMGSAILAEGGDRLGNAVHGFHDFQWSDDTIRKVHVGHYTFNFGCPVKDPKMFAICEDVVAMGHIHGGENVTFIQDVDEFRNLQIDPDNTAGCILVKMVPYFRGIPQSPQDIAGRWNQTIVIQCNTDGLSGENPIHGLSTYFYAHLYNLDRINQSMAQREPQFHSPTSVVNTVGWRGHHRLYNPENGKWDLIMLDDGPFGHNVYKGVISDRDVSGRSIREMDFDKTCSIYS